MPERTSYEPGTPSWVDLSTSDIDAAKGFYTDLFGWQAEEAGSQEETGGYLFFTKNGKKVAGAAPLMSEGQPVAWSTYISTDDLDGLTQRARDAGADVMVEPMEVMHAGRMAFFSHPAGGFVGAWEPGQHKGAELVNEPGSMNWNELQTRDVEGAKEFGRAVFGWDPQDQDMGGSSYTIINVGENGVAGMMAMPPGVPDGMPSYWVAIFMVDDVDDALETIKERGGGVMAGPMEMEGVGRFAYVHDPQGANFGVISNVANVPQ